ncbi:MAG: PEP-CTERM sorting domain-containing protein [Crocosphaera sp.]|nr:PEP-CTERM sorting domain-containing protein [Crocosphaera sp.]
MKNSQNKILSLRKNKGFSYAAISLAVASVFGSTSVANAATFSFSFSNETGSVEGAVEGTIELPDGDGILAATSLMITSAPTEVLPPNGTDFVTLAESNSFEVVNGEIVNSTVNFFSTVNGFNLDFLGPVVAILTNQDTSDSLESSIDSVNFTPVVESTPEPSSLITLMTVGVLGLTSKLKKKS